MGLGAEIAKRDLEKNFEKVKDRIEYPKRKDFTDGELAVAYAVDNGYEDIVLIAMTGDRFDHSIADILLLEKCKNGVLIDDNNEIILINNILLKMMRAMENKDDVLLADILEYEIKNIM